MTTIGLPRTAPDPSSPEEPPLSEGAAFDEAQARQWQLIWRRFRRHRVALLSSVVLAGFVLIVIFADFIAPYSGTTRDGAYVLGPPQLVKVWDSGPALPYVNGVTTERDPETLRQVPASDPDVKQTLQWFVRGEEYHFLGVIETDWHLFGVSAELDTDVEPGEAGVGSDFVHVLGTDELGRDLFSRLMIATRTSLTIGLVGLFVAFVLGLVFGGIAGYLGGSVDYGIQRLIEIIRSIPTLPMVMALAAAFPREWSNVKVFFFTSIALGLVGWTTLARRIRGMLLALRGEDYVMAARLSGASTSRIIARHMLPAFTSYIIVTLTIEFPYMILAESVLSFIGLGLRPPTISWGVLLQDVQRIQVLEQAPWLFAPVGLVIVALLAFNFFGDGLRDAADPYQEGL